MQLIKFLLVCTVLFYSCKKKSEANNEPTPSTNNTSPPAVTYTTITTELALVNNTSPGFPGTYSTSGVKKAVVRCGTSLLDSVVGIPVSNDPPMGDPCQLAASNKVSKALKIQNDATNYIDVYDGSLLLLTCEIKPSNQIPFSNSYLAPGVSCYHTVACKYLVASVY